MLSLRFFWGEQKTNKQINSREKKILWKSWWEIKVLESPIL